MVTVEKNKFIATAQRQITVNNMAIEAIQELVDASKAWDGKVFNKRFPNAMRETISSLKDGKFYITNDVWANAPINLRASQKLCYVEYKGYGGRITPTTIERTKFSIRQAENPYVDKDNKNRFNYEHFKEAAKAAIECISSESKEVTQCVQSFDGFIAKAREINAMIEDFKKKTPYPLKAYIYSAYPSYITL